MQSFYLLIYEILGIYLFVILATVIMSWLVAFNVVNMRNRFVAIVADILQRLTEPVLKPLRRLIPSVGGLDLTPMILWLGVWFLRNLMVEYLMRPF